VNVVESRRPTRGKAREQAVLSAVIELLGEVGYEAMTMDAVAARAHASKATIYKRWRGKPELVRAAVDTLVAARVPAAVDNGSLRDDLMAVMRAMEGHLTADFLAMMSGLVHAMRRDPALAEALRAHLMDGAPAARLVIGRAVARGELRGGAEAEFAALAHEVIEAHLFRQMAVGGSLGEVFAVHVVDDLLIPVLTRRSLAAT
jgi:AcrR family transcriptional regulator